MPSASFQRRLKRTTMMTWFALGFIVLTMVALVVMPLWVDRQQQALRREVDTQLQPAQRSVGDLQRALTLEVSARSAYLLTGDAVFLRGARRAENESRSALTALVASGSHLPDPLPGMIVDVQRVRTEWATPWRAFVAGRISREEYLAALPEQGRRFVRLIENIDAIDHELSRWNEQYDEQVEDAERIGSALTIVLALLALVAVMVTARLGGQVQSLARDRLRLFDAEQQARREAESAAKESSLRSEQAENALAQREQVLRVVAHDLRTPLSSITLSATAALRSHTGGPILARQLKTIKLSSERMEHLIQDLLDVTRMQAGRPLPLTFEPLDPRQLLVETCERIQPLAQVRHQHLTLEVDDDLPLIRGDRRRVLQAIGNLAGNAVKFTPADGSIELHARREGRFVRFAVSDTGPGIADEARERIFEPFRQEAGQDLGVGLGLAIARAIVEAHGGTLGLKTVEGHGSTFTFTVPVYEAGDEK